MIVTGDGVLFIFDQEVMRSVSYNVRTAACLMCTMCYSDYA